MVSLSFDATPQDKKAALEHHLSRMSINDRLQGDGQFWDWHIDRVAFPDEGNDKYCVYRGNKHIISRVKVETVVRNLKQYGYPHEFKLFPGRATSANDMVDVGYHSEYQPDVLDSQSVDYDNNDSKSVRSFIFNIIYKTYINFLGN